MKNRLPIIILAVALLISLGGNVYLIVNQSALKNQLTDANNLLAEANSRIDDLNNQLADYENLQAQLTDLQEQLNQKNDAIAIKGNAVGEDAIPETPEDKALAEQAKQEAESTSAPQSTEKPKAEIDFPALPPEIADMFEGPGRIDENTPGYVDIDGSKIGEGDYSKGNGMIVH